MKIVEVQHSLELYDDTLSDFASGYQLPADLFASPDHFAIKCANQIDYFDTCDELAIEVHDEGLWELELDDRFLASARLAGSVVLFEKVFEWVEIMQPRPGKELGAGFMEHTEFFYPDFFTIKETLKQRGIDYELQQNPGHSWINATLDEDGREVKFNDKPLEAVLVWERQEGLLHKIKRERV